MFIPLNKYGGLWQHIAKAVSVMFPGSEFFKSLMFFGDQGFIFKLMDKVAGINEAQVVDRVNDLDQDIACGIEICPTADHEILMTFSAQPPGAYFNALDGDGTGRFFF